MEELLTRLKGKKIDISFGNAAMFRGDVVEVNGEVLTIKDQDDKTAYVAVSKIAAIYECGEQHGRPGFVV